MGWLVVIKVENIDVWGFDYAIRGMRNPMNSWEKIDSRYIDEKYIFQLYSYGAELYHKYGYKPYFDAGVLRNSLANEFYEGLL